MTDSTPEVLFQGLLRAYHWIDEGLQDGLVRAGFRPRTRTQTMIMVSVSNGVTRAAELARALGVSRQAIQQQINELEAEGLITQGVDPRDRRAHRILFSEHGAAMMSAALEGLRRAEEVLATRIGRDSVNTLHDALTRDWGPSIGGQRVPGRKRTLR